MTEVYCIMLEVWRIQGLVEEWHTEKFAIPFLSWTLRCPDVYVSRTGQPCHRYCTKKTIYNIRGGCWPHLYSRCLTTGAGVFDLYEFLLHAGRSPHLAQGLVRPAILSADWSHDRFTLGWALAARDPKFVDVTFFSNVTAHREARVDTWKTVTPCVTCLRNKWKEEGETEDKILTINTRITQHCSSMALSQRDLWIL